MKRAGVKHEVDLGPAVLAWLASEGFTDIYQEVEAWAGRADIAATCGRLVAIVELKTSLSWELLAQGRRWRGVAHQVWVAVPRAKPSEGRRMAHMVFGNEGIGVLEVQPGRGDLSVQEVERPAFNRRAEVKHVRDYLAEGQKTAAPAGTARGGQWSKFKETCRSLRIYVGTNPGASIGDAVKSIKHHYGSDKGAKGRLVTLITSGVIDGVEVEHEGRTPRLYLKNQPRRQEALPGLVGK